MIYALPWVIEAAEYPTVSFLIEWVKPLVLDFRAFEELISPPEYKDLVLAFAKQQDEKAQKVDDIISGKG